ncbi:MAG TPA: FAD-binding oxidoreductase [Acidimicrobiales bacterium]|nr:FAD-binding oxidoreductase [Acidimicrobiales bacterium]
MTRRAPAAPVPLSPSADAGGPTRLGESAVELDDAFLTRLRSACATVSVEPDDRVEGARDWWPLALTWAAAGQVPARAGAVASPATAAEVASVLALCAAERVPVTPAGGRSGVCGASIPLFGGVVLDLCGLGGIDQVDDASLLVRAGAGTFGDDLEATLRTERALTIGHWPQSVELSTVGGWLACRGAGQYSTRYGKIEDMVAGLEVVLADGRTVHTGGLAPRSATGPDLTQLFVGSEGTLGVITSALLRAHPVPSDERRSAWGFPDFGAGLEACRRILRRGATPAVLRLYDPAESARSFGEPEHAVLVMLDEGDALLVDATATVVADECQGVGAEALDDALVGRWLEHRNDVSALGALIGRGYVVDTIEVAGRWAVLDRLYGDVTATLSGIEGTLAATAHQSHAYGDGACLYFTFAGRPPEGAPPEWAESYYLSAWDAVMEATMGAGAAISHHHGIGLNRSRHLPRSLGPAFDVMVAVKAALDPNGVLNPGKLGLPSPFGAVSWP